MRNLSSLIGRIKPSPIREMLKEVAELRYKGYDVIQLSTGQPSLPLDDEVLEGLINVMRKERLLASSYTPTGGMRQVLEAISNDLKEFGGIDVSLEELVITEGATEGILLTALATLDKDDELIMMDPSYVSYPNTAIIAGAKPVFVEERIEEGYQPNIERIKEKINQRTKGIIIASPDNPTGRVLKEEVARALIDLSEDHDIWLIIDEAYKHLIYDGEHFWFWRDDRARERTICINTFSKDPAMTGLRLGYIYAPKEVIKAIEKLKQYSTLCSNTPAQIAATIYLNPKVKKRVLDYTLKIYKSRRDKLYECMKEYLPEARTVKPEGAMYLFADMKAYLKRIKMSDYEFMIKLAREKHVAVVYGEAFGEKSSGHIRFTFVGEPEERIERGIKLVKEFIEEHSIQ